MLRRLGSALGGSKGRATAEQEQQQQPPSPSSSSSNPPQQHVLGDQPRPSHAMAPRQPPSSAMSSTLPPPRGPPALGGRMSSASGGIPRLAYVYSVPLIHRIGASWVVLGGLMGLVGSTCSWAPALTTHTSTH